MSVVNRIDICILIKEPNTVGDILRKTVILKTVITGNAPGDFYGWLRLGLDAITVAVTVIVCAVPEGLPMLTSILLSFQSMKMAKDNRA